MSDAGDDHSMSENGGLKRSNEESDDKELVVTKKFKQDSDSAEPEAKQDNTSESGERGSEPQSNEPEKEVSERSVESENTASEHGKKESNENPIEKAESSVKTEDTGEGESGVKTEESNGSGMKTEESGVKAEESGVKAEESGVKAEESGVKTEESGVKTEESGENQESEGKLSKEEQTYLPTEAPPPLIQVMNPITGARSPTPEFLPRVDPKAQADSRAQTDSPNKGLPPGVECGIVKWYDITKGFGFILRESGDDVFIHQTSIPSRPGQRGLADKEPVWFKVTREAQGRLRAHDITGPHGAPLRGVPDVGLIPSPTVAFGASLQHSPLATPVAPTPPTNPNDFPPHTTTPLPPGRQRGYAKWFNIQKGFGFIAPEDGTDDIFCHQSNLLCVEGAFRSLAEKENLEFEIVDEPNLGKAKRKATNVTGPGGRPVIGVSKPTVPGMPNQMPMPYSVRPFQPPAPLAPRGGSAPFAPPGLPQGPEARPPSSDPYGYYSQYFAHNHPGQQPPSQSPQHLHPQHPQYQQQQMFHQQQLQQQQYHQQMLQQQQYQQQNPEHAAAWAAYYAAQAQQAGGAQGQQNQAQGPGQQAPVQGQQASVQGQQASVQGQQAQGQQVPVQGQQASTQGQQIAQGQGQQGALQGQQDQQTAEHQAAWQNYYAQLAALQAQQGQSPQGYPTQ